MSKNVDVLLLAQKVTKIGTWEVDVLKNTCCWSDITYELHEIPKDTKISVEDRINYFVPAHRPIIEQCVKEGIKSEEPWDVEVQIITGAGKTKWIRAIGQAVKDKGKLVRLKGIFLDIDEKKKSELRYEELYVCFKLATQVSDMGIWDWDIINDELTWDDKMFEVYGVKKDTFSSALEAWQSLIHPDDLERANLEVTQAIEGIKDFNTQFRSVTADGEIRQIKALSNVVRDENNKAIRMIGTNWDITKSYEAEQNLIKLNEELVQFAYRTSHDLKSPLLSMKSIVALAIESVQTKDYTLLEKDLKLIDNLINKLTTLIQDMMDLTKIDHLETALEDFNIESEVMTIYEEYQFNLAKHKIDTEIDNKLEGLFKTDSIRLRHILNNLLSNSIKYYDPNKSSKEIMVECYKKDSAIVIKVKDNGIGIPKEHQHDVFKMFKRFNQTQEGTGLGLYMVKKNIEVLKGSITFKSSPKQTVFTVKIPIL